MPSPAKKTPHMIALAERRAIQAEDGRKAVIEYREKQRAATGRIGALRAARLAAQAAKVSPAASSEKQRTVNRS